ncbi:MAG: T9SS type A sorting domain-containing protein [Bacteroidetes bacterium]|nr:T9SS type A sorting domain-containing protein [Bacteroidota bacterium]
MRIKSTGIFLFFFIALSLTAFSQASLYTPYAFSTGTPATFPAGTTVGFTTPFDDDLRVITPGFSFQCGGQVYNNFLVSSNGWVACLPSAAIPPYFASFLPANSLSGYAGGTPLIAPMWDDIAANQFVWSISGTDLFIRWNAKMPKNSVAYGYTFGVRLSAAGAISFIYPTSVYNMNGAGANSASIGYASGCGEYYSITPTAAATATASDAAEFTTALSQIVTTWTGTAGNTTINVGSSAGIVPGLFIGGGTGANIAAPGATVSAVAGTVVTSSANNTGALSGNGYFYLRPNNVQYVLNPTMVANDLCANATSLGTISGTCNYITASNAHNTKTAATGPTCAVADTGDVWFSFIKPAGVNGVTITTAPVTCPLAMTGTTVELYTSCGGTPVACSTTGTTFPTYGQLTAGRSCLVETLYVRVTGDNNKYGKFQICATTSSGPFTSLGTTCSDAQYICSLPFTQNGMTTAGAGNEYDSLNAQCHDPYLNGEDYVFAYSTGASPICIQVEVNSSGTNPSIFVYDGCPNSGTTHCIASTAGVTGIIQINSISLVPNTTYYIIVDNNPLNATSNIPFDISITSLGTTIAYDPCSAAQNLGSIANNTPCAFSTFNTECAQATAAGTITVPPCGNFVDGLTPDVWLRFTPTFTGSLLVKTQVAAANPTSDAAMAIYSGANCGALTLIACDDNSAGSSMPLLSIPVTNGVTYFIRMWTVSPANTGNFDLCLSSACGPPNDVPCTAVYVPLGGTASGYNTCSGALNEPPNSAQCVVGGIVNTVWYKAVVPANGTMKIRTHPLTLTDTQIQAFTFSGGCANSATTYTSRGCNDDGPDCGVQSNQSYHDYSELVLTGLTVNDTVFIAVDGFNSQTGTFEITVIDGTVGALAPVYLQDCEYPYEVCGSTSIVVPDPGPLNFGNVCDFTTSYDCWANGERNSVWYKVTVNPGTLQFSINSVTDYDFIMWDITGVSNPCALIQTHSLASTRCNWTTSTGQTGISNTAPSFNWENSITSATQRSYLILIDNWNPPSFVTGFTLDWMGSPIASNPSSVNWSGAVDTNFTSVSNWGTAPCNASPSCTVDAYINASTFNRNPTINSTVSVRNVVINSGATLRLKANAVLEVCGDFTNNGTLIAEPGSVVKFIGTVNQFINGSVTGANAFYHLTVDKTAGTVLLNANTDIAGNFTTVTNTSKFNINNKVMKIGGNFTNVNGVTTFLNTNYANSRVEFNGLNNQYFTNSAGAINLNRVTMNKPSGKLYLMGANSSIAVDSVLTLTSGIIDTRNLPALEIYLKWINAGAIVGYNAGSYIDGNLKRQIYNFGYDVRGMLLDWPVGDSISGYQLANILFSPAGPTPGVSYLIGSFNSWTGFPPAVGPTASECVFATYDAIPIFDHGYWTFRRATTANYNGNYKMTLYNNNYTNNTGVGWTIAVADLPSNVNAPASWRLTGSCVTTSLANNTQRIAINATASATNFFDLYFATVQSLTPLPIELLSFTADPYEDNVLCKWVTASETNNDYFEVLRSTDGVDFKKIGIVYGYGAGTSTTNRSYQFIDDEECNSIRYYQLRQVDTDLKFAFSDVVAVNCNNKDNVIQLYPNPATDQLNITFYQFNKEEILIEYVDMLGKIVASENYSTTKGFNKIESSILNLPNGIYYLKIKSGNPKQEDRQIRFVKE